MSIREIVIISGKGGTGKTTLTASLAAVAEEGKILADADVDAPNLALLLHPEETFREPFRGMSVAEVDRARCTGCGVCEESCRYDAIHVRDGKAVVDEGFCEGCRVCLHVCPEQCISLKNFERGTIRRGDTALGPLWHARLNPGGENTGLMVALLRKEARKEAEEAVRAHNNRRTSGIGCPVTSSVTGPISLDRSVCVCVPVGSPGGCGLFGILAVLFGIVANRWKLSEELRTRMKTCGEKEGPSRHNSFRRKIAEAVGAGRIPPRWGTPAGLGVQYRKQGG
jgi:MinD superfamily P-loop ATPase